eukprot:COSAG03_NODE_1895_length_3382_cov_7.437709_5_plen_88_part_00
MYYTRIPRARPNRTRVATAVVESVRFRAGGCQARLCGRSGSAGAVDCREKLPPPPVLSQARIFHHAEEDCVASGHLQPRGESGQRRR